MNHGFHTRQSHTAHAHHFFLTSRIWNPYQKPGGAACDLMKNPLIVPLKILKGHKIVKYLGVQTCKFHPTLPWLFTGGGDGKVYLWVE